MPTSVALTPYFENFTKQLVSTGRYNNVSEVIRDSLRVLEENKSKKPQACNLCVMLCSWVPMISRQGVSKNLRVRQISACI
ncbi:MAG: type II toxin-antitoxin system ParD family antitoxin [Brachymonas sp.]|nr:type II toxin-antitoxin system ParD family antitoxin [Brachymonas sp.]